MSQLRKILIAPFFGELPPWMDKFQPPKGYDILIDQDLNKFKERVRSKLGIEFPGEWGSPKLWDYRCALGLLYEEEIRQYQYWGHCDFDVVFGDVNKFLPDDELVKWDVYSGHDTYVCGCFSLYRNIPRVNALFSMSPVWKARMMDPVPNGWVETDYSRALESSGLKYIYTFHQGNPWTNAPELKKDGDSLFQNIEENWQEIMFFHFRHSKKWPL